MAAKRPTAPPLCIVEPGDGILIELAYATSNNFFGSPLYRLPLCLLRPVAALSLQLAASSLWAQGYLLCVRDAFRPALAQSMLWAAATDKSFVASPRLGSTHTRGIAVDVDLRSLDGTLLDMGSSFDEMSPASAHGATGIAPLAAARRAVLAKAMERAGFERLPHEWWHYQLPQAAKYSLIADAELGALNPMDP